MSFQQQIDNLLYVRELEYGAVIAVVAVLVLLLIRKRPQPQTLALFLGGALITVLSAPLLQAAFTFIDHWIAGGEVVDTNGGFWRTLWFGIAGAIAGVTGMALAWRESPDR